MELWVPGSSSCEQTSPSKIDAFSSVVVVMGQPLPLWCSVNPVSLVFLIKLWNAMQEHSKLGYSFQILYEFQPFSSKSFSMTAFCLWVKAILLCLSELENCETSKWRPVTSTDFDLHCNGFLHCHDLFTRQRQKKTNQGSFKSWNQTFLQICFTSISADFLSYLVNSNFNKNR